MQEPSQPTTYSRRTHASNAQKHPGLLDAPPKRHTPAEKQSDEAQQSEFQALKEAKTLLTLANIAASEAGMEAAQLAKRSASRNLKGILPTVNSTAKESVTAAVVPKCRLYLD
jgi:hypothetical protein